MAISPEDLATALNLDAEKLKPKPDEALATTPTEQPSAVTPEAPANGQAGEGDAPPDSPALPGDSLGLDLSGMLDEPAKPTDAPVVEPVPGETADLATKEGRAFAAMRKQINDLSAKLEIVQAVPIEDPEVIKGLKSAVEQRDVEIEKLMDQIGSLDLERDPRFVERYSSAETTIDAQILETAKELEVSDEIIHAALELPLKKRIEYLSEEAGAAAPTLLTLFAQKDALTRQKRTELTKHKDVRQQLDEQRGVSNLAMEQQARARLFQGALSSAKEGGNFVFQADENNPQRAELAKKATGLAEELFKSNDGQRQADAMILGVAAPVYLHMLHLERAKRVKAEKELALRFGKRPAISSNGGATSGSSGAPVTDMSAEDAAAAVASRLGAG